MFSITSDSWKAIVSLLNKDRAALLESLVRDSDQTHTATLRGKVAQIDEILNTYPKQLSKPANGDD